MITRGVTSKINFVFDQLLPPILRDSKWFMGIWFAIVFKEKKNLFMNFKQNAFSVTDAEFAQIYLNTRDVILKRDTDLNRQCADAISANLLGDSVIDIGCGNGYMVERLRSEHPDKYVCGSDIALTDSQKEKDYYFNASAQDLSRFEDGSFQTVICSHVLEHVKDFNTAFSEIRRIASRRVIVVVPCQREYRYTFDLHLRFFPYPKSFLNYIQGKGMCKIIGGDIFYIEEV